MTNEPDQPPRLSPWILWTLRGLLQLGGSAAPRALELHVAKQLEPVLNPGQIARVLKSNYLRWSSYELRKAGYLAGAYGTWELTPAGRDLAERRVSEAIQTPTNVPELPPEQADYNGPTESVPVTSFDGLKIPVLRALESGRLPKQDLLKAVEADIGSTLLPGDRRLMSNGQEVWRFRTSWALSDLKKGGAIRNEGNATWELTESGRERLKQDGAGWSIKPLQTTAKATVRAVSLGVASPPPATPPEWPTAQWLELNDELPASVLSAITRRIRPELGPTPELSRGTLPRNVVLYGPPGTGKTHVARLVAAALTEEDDRTAERAWRLVQFHPSYSYEDFVQGMRPDLTHSALRYEMKKGPFSVLCDTAVEDPDNFYVLVIDEINRGDPARIFGELLYALEYRGEAVDLALGGQLVVPPNLVVIGTMNSVDRSVALVDYALRRRFTFVRLDPEPDAIRRVRGDDVHTRRAAQALGRLNTWLTARLDREHAIGHSFFLSPTVDLAEPGALGWIWRDDLLPLLEEYFVGDAEGLDLAQREWDKILADLQPEPGA